MILAEASSSGGELLQFSSSGGVDEADVMQCRGIDHVEAMKLIKCCGIDHVEAW
jgi:hypothetical protein